MTKFGLGVGKVLSSGDHVTSELWSEVVKGILGDVVPFGLGSLGSEFPLVSEVGLGISEGGGVVNDILVDSVVWNWIVQWISEWSLLVLVLGASGR